MQRGSAKRMSGVLLVTCVIFLTSFIVAIGSAWWPNTDQSHNQRAQPSSNRFAPSIVPAVHLNETTDDFSHGTEATFHAHGDQVCASGCAASRHPTDRLTKRRFLQLLDECSQSPLNANNLAFETLLFFGRQTSQLLDDCGSGALTTAQALTLRNELTRQHAFVSIRLVDVHGDIRSKVCNVRVPLDRRHVFSMTSKGLPPLVTSGTVKRVGQKHLWTRL